MGWTEARKVASTFGLLIGALAVAAASLAPTPAQGLEQESWDGSTEHEVYFDGSQEDSRAMTENLEVDFEADFQDPTFFDELDRKISSTSTGRRLVVERYYRLLARLSVFALYCDEGNKRGLSTNVSRFRERTTALFKEGEKIFGGAKNAYNKFERQRNEESLRFVRSDQELTCSAGVSAFGVHVARSRSRTDTFLSVPWGQR